MLSVPQKPHEDVVVASLGVGSGARLPVETVTMLKADAAAEPFAVLHFDDWLTAQPSLWQKPTASSKSWPGVRMVVATLVPSSPIANGSSVARVTGRRPRDGSSADQGRTSLVRRDRELTPSGYA